MIKTRAGLALTVVALLASCASDVRSAAAAESEFSPWDASGNIVQQEMTPPPVLANGPYVEFMAMRRDGPVVPGIFQAAVPQGMAYAPQQDLLLISSYMDDGRPSCIVTISISDGLLRSVYWIEEPDGTPHTGHAGGLAVSRRTLWVASGPGVFHVALDKLDGRDTLRMDGFVETVTKGSFATIEGDTLWVGEFTRSDGSYRVPKTHNVRTDSGLLHHGWMAGYPLEPESDLIPESQFVRGEAYPEKIVSIPHEVQGASFIDNKIVLSHSYGRQNRSRISVYENPMSQAPWGEFSPPSGPPIPIWVLDQDILSSRINAPPMSEGVVVVGGELFVLFESGSDKYRETALDPLDRVQILDLSF